MMERLLRDHRLLAVGIGLVAVAGLAAAASIVRQEDPTLTNGVALVLTPFPGASAEDVERLVTEPIETLLLELPGIEQLESTSRTGLSVISVQIDERLGPSEVSTRFSRIRDALRDIALPKGARPPLFDDERFGAFTFIAGVAWEGEGPYPQAIIQRLGRQLEERLRAVPGTQYVKRFGAVDEEIQVRVDPERLAAAGLGVAAVADALGRADAKGAAGVLRRPDNQIIVEVDGELDGPERIRRVPIAISDAGAVLRVGELADVERGFSEPPRELARIDGRPGVAVATKLAAGVRFDQWAERVRSELDRFEAELPAGAGLDLVFDQTGYTEARLGELNENLAIGLGLVVLVLLVGLGGRAALVVTSALPLVMLASVAVLFYLGVPIHQMSVTGLIVALGLLVDNAIVVCDAIRSRRLAGEPALAAVRASVQHLWVPLLASTFTTVLAFLPILLLPGRVGEFVGAIGLSVIVALIASYIVALTVIPALSGRFLRPGGGRIDRGLELPRLSRWFQRSLDASLHRPWRSMALASVLPIAGFASAPGLPKQFFPPADRDQFHVELRLPASASIAATERATHTAEALLRSHPEVQRVDWFLGRSAPPFYYNMLQTEDGNPAFAQALVKVAAVKDVRALLPALQRQMDGSIPEAQVILRELGQGPPVAAPIEIRVIGPRLGPLLDVGEALRARMAEVASIEHSSASLRASTPALRFSLSEEDALLSGLSPTDISRLLGVTLDGLPGGTVLEGSEELPVRVRADRPHRASVERLYGLPVPAPKLMSLSALGDFHLVPRIDGIPRRDGQRVNVIRGYVAAGTFADVAQSELMRILQTHPISLPPGFRIEMGGEAEKRSDALGNLFAFVPVLIVLMVASLALALSSFRLAAVILGTAVQAMGFGLLSLALLRHPLGFQAMIGLIGLVGIAINAGIVISAALQADPAAVAGDRRRIRSVVAEDTSRHIIATTVTTFGGFLPLLLADGGFWPPFAAVLAGGVVLSTIGSFYFVPAAFALLTRRRPLARFGDAP